jgi:DASS family divalent anion:Na+ symporter
MITAQMKRLFGILALALFTLLTVPVPEGLSVDAWQLALIFATTILCVLGNALPIFTASISALTVAVLSGVLEPAQAYSGFSESFILLIVAAFLVARAVVKSGLGHRIAWMIIARFGHSTLGLAYSLVATDLCIAPAFPSNTARSGVLFPIAEALALSLESEPEPASRKRAGAFLMMVGMGSLSISSALWMTAMAANAAGVAIAREQGIDISFGSWLLTASVPCLLAAMVLPRLVYRCLPPDLQQTPEAPVAARRQLQDMGPMGRQEVLTAIIFGGMVLLWGLADIMGTDLAAIAFGGLALLMLIGVFDIADLQQEGGTLEVLVWFAILYAMSTALNQMGFMAWLGNHISAAVGGLSWPLVYAVLLFSYIGIHYFFVSQTAHLLALFPVYLEVGIGAGVPGALMAFSILFATNYFSALTPQASSANVIFAGSGYLEMKEIYRTGLLLTLVNTLIIGLAGALWIMLIN